MPENRLSQETSPYLLQHKDNPVHWMPWGSNALETAQRQDKPILLSVGYAACHWCHVMAHESFEDDSVAELMNRLFVNIKVDREERPDLDAIYQASLAMLGQQGGWPLTMFLTPDGEPFWGGTYFPPQRHYGRPAFTDVLNAVADIYRSDPERVQSNVVALRDGLARLSQPAAGEVLHANILDQIADRLLNEVDFERGGIGGAPKFPQPSILEQLWRAWIRTGRERFRDAVTVSLDNMCQGGIYDHIGGGFARYAVDARWLVPHFEKMLYDNAQLIELLSLVWQQTRSPLYAARVRESVEWLEREMVTQEGAFASSIDADSEGVEGKFYVWDEKEVRAVLGPDADEFMQVYDINPNGNWEGRSIPNRLANLELQDEATEARLADCRNRLLEVRAGRVRPGLDDKVLADWNGLMIRALARAGLTFGRSDWIGMAERAFAFVSSAMTDGDRLLHSSRNGDSRHPATLDDYANMASAAVALFEAVGSASYLETAERWIGIVDAHYADSDGGYYFVADDTDGLIVRMKTANDNAVPAGNGTLVDVYGRLHALTGQQRFRTAAERIVSAFSGEIAHNFFPLSTLFNSVDTMLKPVQIVVVGPEQHARTQEIVAAAFSQSLPGRVLTRVGPDQALPQDHPAHGKGMVDGDPAAYVCIGQICSLPFVDVDALANHLGNVGTSG